MSNLESTLESAEDFVSKASIIATLESDEFRTALRTANPIDIRSLGSPTGHRTSHSTIPPRNSDDGPPRLPPISISDSKETDLQPHMIAGCKPLYEQAYATGNYKEAKRFLERYRKGREQWEGVTFEGRDAVLEMLVLCCCRLEEWTNAELLLESTEFVGREGATKRLVCCYNQEKNWDSAEKILAQNDSKYDDIIWKRHVLAEVYFAKKNYELAMECCQRARQEISFKYGDADRQHTSYFLSIALLAEIMEERGTADDKDDARLLREMLPPKFDGMISECIG
jgi:hypothetical protein